MIKKIIISLLFCFALLGFTYGQYSTSSPQDLVEQKDTTLAKDSLSNQIVLPNTPFGGTVEVSFRIDMEGSVDIVNINSNNPELIQYVINKLSKIKLDPTLHEPGKMITYRFTFKKQA